MGKKILMKGNEAIGEAAIIAGCRHYFGYPITPQSELPAYLAMRLPQVNGVFLQAESEVAAINMVYGCGGCGKRVMTSSSSPGVSLKQEGISYLAGSEVPALIVNIVRGGPGLGNIAPEQSDYYQATRGGGHGNYRTIVLSPNSVQEMVDHTILGFDLAEKYRTPMLILGDGFLGQMMEPVTFPEPVELDAERNSSWATTGAKGRSPKVINSIYLDPDALEAFNMKLVEKYNKIKENEVRFEEYLCEDADLIAVSFGITSRILKGAIEMARKDGLKIGLFRPISLWPFPEKRLAELAENKKAFFVAELNTGQMVDDVKLAVNGKKKVHWYGRCGGVVPTQEEIFEKVKAIYSEL
ncbi:3-methyl-2-oxobutanoate dehydrogenase subunit VorB [Candidatus Riflebacteria bacterium]